MGCHFLLQGIFLTQRSNLGLLHCRQILYHWAIWEALQICVFLVAQSCLTLCNIMDCSLPGSSVLGISWVSILEWVATSFSRGSSQCKDRTCISFFGRWIFYLWATREAVGYSKWFIFYVLCIMLWQPTIYSILCLCSSLRWFFKN